ncbi:MAG: hypothetical protein PQJ47_09605 [Sphaerochaetaceae bacterium]|nr:hypothetical protein [Sphaerochaetaceae bacterium]
MKRGMRATIRRKPDYERDPDWDLSELLEGKERKAKRRKDFQRDREDLFFDEDLSDSEEFSFDT